MDNSNPNSRNSWAHTHTDRAIHHDIKERARAMRNNSTLAEIVLRQRLRRKQVAGFRFRRQHPIDRFVVDFYCPAARLAIEIDGSIHDAKEQKEYDAARQAFLQDIGLQVLRFSNAQVINETDAVLEIIAAHLPANA